MKKSFLRPILIFKALVGLIRQGIHTHTHKMMLKDLEGSSWALDSPGRDTKVLAGAEPQ